MPQANTPTTSLVSVPPPSPLYPGLNTQALGLLGGLGGASGKTLTGIASGGGQQAFMQMAQALSANNQLQQKQGVAQIREQFGVGGLSNSSPAGVATGNYLTESNTQFLTQLAQLQLQAQQQALEASSFGLNAFLQPALTTFAPKVLSSGPTPLQAGTDIGGTIAQIALLAAMMGGAV